MQYTEKQLRSKIKLLDGRPAAGDLNLPDFLEMLISEVSTEDSTIPLDNKTLKRAFIDFGNRWFDAIPQTDATLNEAYTWPGYLSLLYECFYNWTFRSTAYSVQFLKKFQLEPETALVYADGFGAASLMFATAMPNCKVTGQIMGEKQWKIANRLQDRLNVPNLALTQDFAPANNELVLAFESFEHFQNPIPVAQRLLTEAKVLIYTAPWKVRAHGHFLTYKGPAGEDVSNEDFSKVFGRFLRDKGFIDSGKALDFKFFNAYPRIYLKV